ncbi:hypothetical protein [Streptomyces qinglanensis]|uniref:DUF8175 domain-containing protein n=1 Tax=Streptomyces qinglanensis TaxID=943816 RepID=A0A1H9WI54_9ACTN|nr:hypothetical protein [Streptomyces qinglanensis]SES33606.1 hypothetical protein SAMN05421870_1187 [Streptomyces qinglanensis]
MNIGGGEYDARTRTSEGVPGARDGARTTTRTRLPGGDSGGNRPSNRPGRSLVTVVAVVVLLIAAIAFANRGGGDEGGGGGGTASDSKNDAATDARPTAPSGEKPVKNSPGALASGFAHDEQGAQSAAANYAVALGGEDMFSSASRDKIVDSVYAPRVTDARKVDFDKTYGDPEFLQKVGLDKAGKAPEDTTFVARTTPVGAKVIDFSDKKARVAVWYSGLFGLAGKDSKRPVTESWYTTTFEMSWVKDDWKVTDFKQKDGPTPIGKDQAASSADEMADAVKGFGGFTYAR